MRSLTRWHGKKRRIGLTGGIATGKSSVGRHISELGIAVLDADLYSYEALVPGSDGARAVLNRYGALVENPTDSTQDTTTSQSSINRKALGSIVFNNPDEREWLESLIHPQVRQRFEEALAEHADSETVVLMIPLLFEAGFTDLCAEIWVVHCLPEQQLERLQKRDQLDEAAAMERIAAQWPLEQKQQLADQLIDNSSDTEQWKKQIKQALKLLSSTSLNRQFLAK